MYTGGISMLVLLLAVFVTGWVAASVIGTQAYFKGEQTKTIHERNWRSESFDQLAAVVTGEKTDYNQRVPGFNVGDAYASRLLPNA
jgi:hypothetical protein